ncbi:MAG: SDR family oxidoreductase [Chloroflexi bacterium]|jgi:NAD(P)-dependent dehydrogenase (short-subunit alcohol dehydrogenase family)|nr:SDR family oxidoreductase [Chloroflexota bacterium]
MTNFDGKVALVTGGGAGIGRATALAFSRYGAKVVVADVVPEAGEETVHLIAEAGGDAVFVKCDVSSEEEVESMINKAVETYGRLDCAANNAGISGERQRTIDCTIENWEMVNGINLKGVWLCMKYEIPQMLKQGIGAIVNTSSMCGLVGAGTPPYVGSKHGVIGLTKSAALEVAGEGVRVNAVCPGVIRTAMVDAALKSAPDAMSQLAATTPMGRFGEPEELANVIVWLCSDEASYVTGVYLPVDGGYVAQ